MEILKAGKGRLNSPNILLVLIFMYKFPTTFWVGLFTTQNLVEISSLRQNLILPLFSRLSEYAIEWKLNLINIPFRINKKKG